MPTYSTRCDACQQAASIRLSFVDYESVKMGVKSLECSACQGKVIIQFNPGDVSFVLKDGESGGFVSKAMKENKYRARHREVMAKRERDHVFKTKLIPNYNGMETGTWKEAREEARSETAKEHGTSAATLVAQTYEPLVKTEQAKP
jgi:predicted nucleic acid-binding Zn ribbon protein